MDIKTFSIAGPVFFTPKKHADGRGFFAETFKLKTFEEATGTSPAFVQDNLSVSTEIGTLRGLHFQAPPAAQAKLVRCGRGAIFDVAVDIRKGSATYGKWVGYELSAENGAQLFIPAGFAHGFATLRPNSEIIYKCSDYYAPETEGALRWDDPAIDINWPLQGEAILSDKDAVAPMLTDLDSPFHMEG